MDAHALAVLEFGVVKDWLAELCGSDGGRAVAERLVPEVDAERIRVSLAQTDEARRLVDEGEPIDLCGVVDLKDCLERVKTEGRPFEPADLLAMRRTLGRAKDLAARLFLQRERAPELARLAALLRDPKASIEAIDGVVEPPGVVVDGASEKLWELRRAIRSTDESVRARLAALIEKKEVKAVLQQPGFTIRGGRFCLAVKLEQKGRVPGILHDRSQTGQTAFIEPQEIVPLTNELRELRHDEKQEEARVLWELTRALMAMRRDLVHTADLLSWFDFTAAKARLSHELGLHAAETASDGVLRLVGARHPLLVRAARAAGNEDAVQPLDLRLGEGFRVLVVTGPNTGGKTVALKTVGLLQAMHQAGLHLPVEPGTRLPIRREIGADIGDEQSISQSLSTFSGHVRNIAAILAKADRDTLVLLDELGAGTDPIEGAALGEAILDDLIRRGALAVVTTHLGSLKDFAFTRAQAENACVEFDPQTLGPTYRLLVGVPGASNALEIARRHGLDADLIERARARVEGGARPTAEVIESLQESRRRLEETRQVSDRRLVRAGNLQKAAEERLRHVEKRERRGLAEARRLLDETLRRLCAETQPVLQRLGSGPEAVRAAAAELAALLERARRESDVGTWRRDFIDRLRKDDAVWVGRLGAVCRVRKIDRAGETLSVRFGRLDADVGFDEITPLEIGEIEALLGLLEEERGRAAAKPRPDGRASPGA